MCLILAVWHSDSRHFLMCQMAPAIRWNTAAESTSTSLGEERGKKTTLFSEWRVRWLTPMSAQPTWHRMSPQDRSPWTLLPRVLWNLKQHGSATKHDRQDTNTSQSPAPVVYLKDSYLSWTGPLSLMTVRSFPDFGNCAAMTIHIRASLSMGSSSRHKHT